MTDPVVSWCRHCGWVGELTREHIPPRSTGNDQPVRQLVEPFDLESVLREVAEWDEGHVVSTLCHECNHRASRWGYVKEYRRWYAIFVDAARSSASDKGVDPLRARSPFEIELPYDVQPARFVRQAIGMFLAVQGSEHLLADHVTLADLVGPDPTDKSKRREDGCDIGPLHLYMSVCNAKWSYLTSPGLTVTMPIARPGSTAPLWTPPGSQARSDDFLLLSLAPFLFVLTMSTSGELGFDISDWTTWEVDRRPTKGHRGLVLPTADQLQGGLRAMVYPRDYVVR